jgi:hypothetical protein
VHNAVLYDRSDAGANPDGAAKHISGTGREAQLSRVHQPLYQIVLGRKPSGGVAERRPVGLLERQPFPDVHRVVGVNVPVHTITGPVTTSKSGGTRARLDRRGETRANSVAFFSQSSYIES